MKFFYLSSQPNAQGHFEIHEKDCPHIPDSINRDYLGPFNNGREAMRKALLLKETSSLCDNCCNSNFQAVFSPPKSKKA
ncbi:hypothetical protein D0X99_11915 [Algoriphagus lacus]|uniref:Uncharacterized protein n=1 Tax=Algoriphagus lacus TaxID=2056311 RepID=A0A418PRB9_9BACT|nr:hypothetical protein D0X99_11915 [Algoriphagus lacus]